MTTRIALATCEQLPDLDPDDQPLVNLFRKIGIEAMPAVWSDSSIDWALFDQIIIRNTWDYTNRLGEFLSMGEIEQVPDSKFIRDYSMELRQDLPQRLSFRGVSRG